ncbi:hypothetical protein DdX_13717 [Ditylenchus destructor]|uniref:Uncharacterized protein n=1 Tax=Ditylenchus destructor TaxID=166010 RepID=A0AAD4MVM3_9BILA|nr:hypothetical protein DdX_13717 [Ditylenchus destructor]
MTEPLKFFKVDHTTIYQDGFSYLFYRDLDPPKSSADLQLHQSFHCALRTQEQNCRSRCHITGNWQMDKKGSKFMLGIVKKADHTHGPEYRDTTPKFRFYKSDDESLHRNGFDYSLYRELDPPKQIADLQWHQTYRCSMSDQENCQASIYTTGQWEKNKRDLQYQLGIFKNCNHSHGSEQDSNREDKENKGENKIAVSASTSIRTEDQENREQIKFYRFKETCVQYNGFVYSDPAERKCHSKWRCRTKCKRQINGKQNCTGYIWTTGKWEEDDRGREFQIRIVMDQHDHEPYQHTKNRCDGSIWTTGAWETDTLGRVYQRGILRGGHSHEAYEQFLNEDDATHVGGPTDDKDGFSYSFHRDLDPPKSSADLQLHQSFHCALRSAQEQNCRSRCHVTGNWQMDKKGSKFMLGIVKKADHTHGPEYRDTTPKFRFYKSDDESLHRNGFDYSLYRELDPPKQIADLQWHQTYRCSMSVNGHENCRATIYTTGQWERNKRDLEYQLGIFKNCIHSHGSDQDSNEEDNKNQNSIVEIASSSNHTKDLDKLEQIRFYKYRQTTVQHNGFVYSHQKDVKRHPQWKHRMMCNRQINGKRTCNGYIWTNGKWDKDDRGREFQIGIVMGEHDHEPHQISFQGKDNDDETPEAGLKFYKFMDKNVHRDGHTYCFKENLRRSPPWKHRMTCTRNNKNLHCNGYIWTTGMWEIDELGRHFQRGILKGGHSHKAYEQFLNEDDTAFVGSGGPMDDKPSLDEDNVVMIGD